MKLSLFGPALLFRMVSKGQELICKFDHFSLLLCHPYPSFKTEICATQMHFPSYKWYSFHKRYSTKFFNFFMDTLSDKSQHNSHQ